MLKFPKKNVSRQDRMEVEGAGWSLLFETEAKDMMGLTLPLLLLLGLFIILSDPMRTNFTVKKGGCAYLCWFWTINRLKSSCRISKQVPNQGRNLNNGMLGPSK